MANFTGKYVGRRVQRNEDPRLLTGQALFVDDVQIPGMLHAAFLRSEYAHARLNSIDTSAAKAREGVVAVWTAEDMGSFWKPGPHSLSSASSVSHVSLPHKWPASRSATSPSSMYR